MSRQTKRHSIIEAIVQAMISYIVSIIAQVTIFPFFGVHLPVGDQMLIALLFMCVSIVRGYIVRRIFNRLQR